MDGVKLKQLVSWRYRNTLDTWNSRRAIRVTALVQNTYSRYTGQYMDQSGQTESNWYTTSIIFDIIVQFIVTYTVYIGSIPAFTSSSFTVIIVSPPAIGSLL